MNSTMNNKENLTMNTKMNSLAPEMIKPLLNLRTGRHYLPTGDSYSKPGQDRNFHLDSNNIPNLEEVKARQKATWESGDFGRIARTIENVAEEFMARLPLHAGTKVLDVACGTGNLAVIAARQDREVTGVDIAGRRRPRSSGQSRSLTCCRPWRNGAHDQRRTGPLDQAFQLIHQARDVAVGVFVAGAEDLVGRVEDDQAVRS